MCHSIANLEHHHFKYAQFRRPGDVHWRCARTFFGVSLLCCALGFVLQPGDTVQIAAQTFGRPLINPIVSIPHTSHMKYTLYR